MTTRYPSRRNGRGSNGYPAAFRGTIELMDSIIATLPDAILAARRQSWSACAARMHKLGYITEDQYLSLLEAGPR